MWVPTAPDSSFRGRRNLTHSTDNGEVKHHLKYENSDKALLRSNSVYSIYVDDLNLLWVGYYQDGADYLPNRQEGLRCISTTVLSTPTVTL